MGSSAPLLPGNLGQQFHRGNQRVLADRNHPANRGLTGCWLLNDQRRGLSQDCSGNGQYATVVDPGGDDIRFIGGPRGTLAGQLPNIGGGGMYWEAPLTSFAKSGDFGIWSAWIQTTTVSGGFPIFMACASGTSSNNGLTMFLDQTTGQVRLQAKNSGLVLDIQGGPNCTDGIWHHSCFVYSKTTAAPAFLYVDGIQVATDTPSGNWDFTGSDVLRLGRAQDTFWKGWLGGIYGVRTYNVYGTLGAVQLLYSDPNAGLYAPYFQGIGASGPTTQNLTGLIACQAKSRVGFTGELGLQGRITAQVKSKIGQQNVLALQGRITAVMKSKAAAANSLYINGRITSQVKGRASGGALSQLNLRGRIGIQAKSKLKLGRVGTPIVAQTLFFWRRFNVPSV